MIMDTTNRLQKTIERIEGAYADATIRAYRSNFMKFIDFCESIGASALPALPQTIADYIENLIRCSCRSATIRQSIASIATIHTLNNYENATIHSEVRLALKRMHRSLGRFSRQAHGINKELLDEMLAATDDSLRGLRDRALLMVAYDTMCRRGELIRFKVEDIDTQIIDRRNNLQSTVIFIEQSKTDQEANGQWLRLSKETSEKLNTWLDSSGISGGYIFRGIDRGNSVKDTLTPGQVCRIYKRLASKAGFTKEFVKRVSGHSMRVGAAQDLLLSGASLPMIMARGRWTKSDTVMRYVEKIGVPV
jgi:site-specific recombinase XerD